MICYVCDRCKKTKSKYWFTITTQRIIDREYDNDYVPKELCAECYEKFLAFMQVQGVEITL